MNDKASLIQALTETHQTIRNLVNSLSDDELSVAYHEGVNPPLWELGHTAFFFEVFILQALDGRSSWNPDMDDIWDSFNIDHQDRWQPGLIPDRDSTLTYVDAIHNSILKRIQDNALPPEELYLYKYAIFHQNMHIESLLWCRQTLGYKRAGYREAESSELFSGNGFAEGSSSQALDDVMVEPGIYRIGMPKQELYDAELFAFDAEKPGFEKNIEAFSISRTLVANQEYLAFVEDHGYEKPDLWSWGGRKWLSTRHLRDIPPKTDTALLRHPLYWKQDKETWLERHFDQWLPLVPEYPVMHVTYWEAEAYCNWAGRRLPTEHEWEAAALGNQKGQPFRKFAWGDRMDDRKVDMNGKHLARLPVTAYPEGDSPSGCRQMIGTVWEWTSSQFLPYDGFTVDMYPFMSALQFGYHRTTRGGSCATSSRLIRGTYRQAYLPERNDAFVGFRTCAR